MCPPPPPTPTCSPPSARSCPAGTRSSSTPPAIVLRPSPKAACGCPTGAPTPPAPPPWQPFHPHDRADPAQPGQIYPVDVELWPTSIVLPAGATLALTISGRDFARGTTHPTTDPGQLTGRGCGTFLHCDPTDRPTPTFAGHTTLHTGGTTPPASSSRSSRQKRRDASRGGAGDSQQALMRLITPPIPRAPAVPAAPPAQCRPRCPSQVAAGHRSRWRQLGCTAAAGRRAGCA
jgi:hypothetical protein